MPAFLRWLANSAFSITLEINGDACTRAGVQALADFPADSRAIRALCFVECAVKDDDAMALALHDKTRLESLTFSDCTMTGAGIGAICVRLE